MSHEPQSRAEAELYCLARALIPMTDDPEFVQKIIAVMLVLVWLAINLSLTLEGIAAVSPPFYGAFTALIFLLVGRLWNIEVQKLLPTGSDDD